MRRLLVVPPLLILAAVAVAQPAPPAPGVANWPFDELTLKNGAKFQGLIIKEQPDGIEFRSVMRLPGRPTVTLTSFFNKDDIADVKRLSAKDRAALKEKLD